MEAFGPLSLLPVAVVILLALLTRRAALALITGTLVGLLLLHGLEFPQAGIALLYDVLSSDLAIWCVVVGSLFGGLTTLFRASGGVNGFSAFTEPLCSNGRRTLLATWLMGVVLFIDDWLCLLTTGTAMALPLTATESPERSWPFSSLSPGPPLGPWSPSPPGECSCPDNWFPWVWLPLRRVSLPISPFCPCSFIPSWPCSAAPCCWRIHRQRGRRK